MSQNSFPDLELTDRLAIARAGTAHFGRLLASLTDAQLDEPSLLEGWTRKHLVAHVGYNAAAISRLVEWAATGDEVPMYPSLETRNEEITSGATLPAHALRNLFDHTAARLDEKWRNLPADRWDFPVKTIQGRTVPVAETAWMRTREVWIHAVDLASGATFAEFPDPVVTSLIDDITNAWRRNGTGSDLRLNPPTGTIDVDPDFTGTRVEISGPAPAVLRWMAGRAQSDSAAVPPRWL
ncbi:maleylpyruvate isomerase family mycothiol-dependent enzyme [Gordonia sp. CPCC 205515]|uniref:maleylpyruvate isomerase family mycothiol-dependent enzyme n=1 Tax=Gordonia sp. CPCC 205515 TaxID=3140791 RepID=UPI003AF342BD